MSNRQEVTEAWSFIQQLIIDYAETLPPAAKVGVQTVARQHATTVAAVLEETVQMKERIERLEQEAQEEAERACAARDAAEADKTAS